MFVLLEGKCQVRADSVVTIQHTVTYNQNEARRMLNVINDYRARNGRSALSYDYALEYAAMQRAAEIAFSYSHTRPDGQKWSTAIPSNFTTARSHSEAENICKYYSSDVSAESSVDSFAASSAHNEAMLNNLYKSAGFGYAVVDGRAYWVQEFSSVRGSWGATSAVNGNRSVSIRVQTSSIYAGADNYSIYVDADDAVDLPVVYQMVGGITIGTYSSVTWTSNDTSIAQISGNQLLGIKIGETEITGIAPDGNILNIYVYVSPRNISKAVISCTPKEFIYSGNENIPKITLVYNGQTLTEGIDYTVSYYSNYYPGTAAYNIYGIGEYGGYAYGEFLIKDKGPDPAPTVAQPTTTTTSTPTKTTTPAKTTKKKTSPNGKPLSLKKAPSLSLKQRAIKAVKGDADVKGSTYNLLRLRMKKAGKNYIRLSWTKVKGASGYVIYGNACGKRNAYKKLASISNGSTTSRQITRINGSRLKKGKYYKFIVVAVKKNSSGVRKAIATSKSIHVLTAGSRKYGNYTSVKLRNISSKKLTLRKGRTFTIRAKAVKTSGKKVLRHRALAYESTKKSVATVTKKGKIKAKAPGTCYIYVYAQNGVCKRIRLTVKK